MASFILGSYLTLEGCPTLNWDPDQTFITLHVTAMNPLRFVIPFLHSFPFRRRGQVRVVLLRGGRRDGGGPGALRLRLRRQEEEDSHVHLGRHLHLRW